MICCAWGCACGVLPAIIAPWFAGAAGMRTDTASIATKQNAFLAARTHVTKNFMFATSNRSYLQIYRRLNLQLYMQFRDSYVPMAGIRRNSWPPMADQVLDVVDRHECRSAFSISGRNTVQAGTFDTRMGETLGGMSCRAIPIDSGLDY